MKFKTSVYHPYRTVLSPYPIIRIRHKQKNSTQHLLQEPVTRLLLNDFIVATDRRAQWKHKFAHEKSHTNIFLISKGKINMVIFPLPDQAEYAKNAF